MSSVVEAAIFDLDGVVTLTARVHYLAWKRLFDDVAREHSSRAGIAQPFDEQAYRLWVDGRPRIEGLRAYLDAAGFSIPEGAPDDPADKDTIMGLSARKNAYFLDLLDREGAEVDQATVALIRELREKGIRIGLATSSRNADRILQRAGLEALFDARVDGVESARLGLRGKPHPDIFLECAKRLGPVAPGSAVLFEDADSGVRAAKAGSFGLVVGVDRNGAWMPLREQGADWIIRSFEELDYERIAYWMLHREHARPNLLGRWGELEKELRERRLALFLDYDGTLTRIAGRPELATFSTEMREAVSRLAARVPTAIVSGRGLEDLKQKVGLGSVWYAAAHGFDIEAPSGSVRHRVLPDLEPLIHRAAAALRQRVEEIEGALLEDKRYSLAVHYRLVDEGRVRELERAVEEVLRRFPTLRKAHGKKVFEIRSASDWDKGRAVEWLLEAMEVKDAVPLYIGDDRTDEDAFAAVVDRGLGVIVTEAPRPTEARWSLQNQEDVRLLLDRLAQRFRTIERPAETRAPRLHH